jgi:hypothetical protein
VALYDPAESVRNAALAELVLSAADGGLTGPVRTLFLPVLERLEVEDDSSAVRARAHTILAQRVPERLEALPRLERAHAAMELGAAERCATRKDEYPELRRGGGWVLDKPISICSRFKICETAIHDQPACVEPDLTALELGWLRMIPSQYTQEGWCAPEVLREGQGDGQREHS